MDANEKIVLLAKSRGLDVELWPTGGGVENVALVISRDANGSPWRVWVGSDCTLAEGFTFSREDRFDGFDGATIWDDSVCPSTDDPVAVVDYIEQVAETFRRTRTYPDDWRVRDEDETDGRHQVVLRITIASPDQNIIEQIKADIEVALDNWDDRGSDEWLAIDTVPSDEYIEATDVQLQTEV